jgi:dTDP-4-amino-4,6-dideoxygalactose transaminase
MGLTSLESMDEFIAQNRRNYEQYRSELSDIPGVDLHQYDATHPNNYQYVVAEVDVDRTGVSRDMLLDVLWAEQILARRYFYPGCHRMQPYRSYFPNAGLMLPVTERVAGRVLVLPTGQTMTTEDVRRVCGVIRCAVANGPEVARRLVESGVRRHHDVFSR